MKCYQRPACSGGKGIRKCLLNKHLHIFKDGSYGCRTLTSTIMRLMKERDENGKEIR